MDVPSYPQWFPEALSLSIIQTDAAGAGTSYRMAQGPVSWRVDVLEATAPQEIRMRYHDGPWDGTALWTLQATPQGGTLLTHSVDLKLQGMMAIMMSKMIDINKLHAEQMEKIFGGLRQWMDKA